jgi:acetoin utilization protein AcuC
MAYTDGEMQKPRCDVVWDPRFGTYDFGPGRWSAGGPRSLPVRLMRSAGLFSDPSRARWRREVPPARLEDLLRFHERPYVELVRRASRGSSGGFLDAGDTPAFPGCYPACNRIVGGALASFESVREGRARRAFHPSGGLHHAHRGRASGFCIFNDLGVALAQVTRPSGPYRRVAYVDIDAHHGDGVMYGFYDSGQILDIDIHQDGRTLFPGSGAVEEVGEGDGAGLKVNIPLPPGAGDRTFASAFLRVVPTLLRSYRPELIALQHGVDGHAGDRLAQLRYTHLSYELAVRTLMGLADELCEGRLVVTGGGGYNPRTVSRILAACGFLLSDREPARGRLPENWRSMYAREIGSPAPARWVDRSQLGVAEERPKTLDRVLRALSGRLGVTFSRGEGTTADPSRSSRGAADAAGRRPPR